MTSSVSGWAIVNGEGRVYAEFHRTRAQAIMSFLCNADGSVMDAEMAKLRVHMFPPSYMTEEGRKAWPKWRRKGFMAVHAYLQVCDHRIQDSRA